jgi:hypothetical protein
MFRVNHADVTDSTDFYFKVERDDGKLLCNFCMADDGLFYYRAKSQILSPKENWKSRDSYDGFLSMENLRDIFEAIKKADLGDYAEESKLAVKKQRRLVTIEPLK